jgi:hypothetical protein
MTSKVRLGSPRTRIQGDHDIVDRHPEKALKFHTELIRIAAGCTWKHVFSLIPVESISTMQHPFQPSMADTLNCQGMFTRLTLDIRGNDNFQKRTFAEIVAFPC